MTTEKTVKRGRKPAAESYIKSTINLDASTDESLRKIHAAIPPGPDGKSLPFGRWLAETALVSLKGGTTKGRRKNVEKEVRTKINPDSGDARGAISEAAYTKRVEAAAARGAYAASAKHMMEVALEIGMEIGSLRAEVQSLRMMLAEIAGQGSSK